MSGCYPNNFCYCGCHPALESCGSCCIKEKIITPMKLPSCKHGLVDHCKECDEKDLSFMVKKIQELEERIKLLDNCILDWRLETQENLKYLDERIEKLSKRIEEIAGFCNKNWKHNKQPHKCPVCDGRYYIFIDHHETINGNPTKKQVVCYTCEGKGIVWG